MSAAITPEAGSLNGRTGTSVALGDQTYIVYPQRIGYLENRLGRWISTLSDMDLSGDSMLSVLGENVYGLLKVFIPKLMPLHEFRGYASEAAMIAGDYDDAADSSPSPDQIVHAMEVVTAVNRFDLMKHVGKLVDPTLLKDYVTVQMANRLQGGEPSVIESSMTTPPTTSTPSGTTPPTSTPNGDSHSPD